MTRNARLHGTTIQAQDNALPHPPTFVWIYQGLLYFSDISDFDNMKLFVNAVLFLPHCFCFEFGRRNFTIDLDRTKCIILMHTSRDLDLNGLLTQKQNTSTVNVHSRLDIHPSNTQRNAPSSSM